MRRMVELLPLWNRLRRYPGGRWLFSRRLGLRVPYTASIDARVEELRAGRATTCARSTPWPRRTWARSRPGMAMLTATPVGVRGIVLRIETTYAKKARGVVAEVTATWLLDREQPPSSRWP